MKLISSKNDIPSLENISAEQMVPMNPVASPLREIPEYTDHRILEKYISNESITVDLKKEASAGKYLLVT